MLMPVTLIYSIHCGLSPCLFVIFFSVSEKPGLVYNIFSYSIFIYLSIGLIGPLKKTYSCLATENCECNLVWKRGLCRCN